MDRPYEPAFANPIGFCHKQNRRIGKCLQNHAKDAINKPMSEQNGIVEITTIKVGVGGREFEFTPEEIRKLKNVIDSLIGPGAAVPVHIPVYIPTPYTPTWNQPIWVNTHTEQWPTFWSTSGSCLSISS